MFRAWGGVTFVHPFCSQHFIVVLARSNGFALERKPLLTLPSSGRTHKKHSPMIAGLNIAVNSTSGRVVTGHSFASTASCTNRTNEPASSSHYAGQEVCYRCTVFLGLPLGNRRKVQVAEFLRVGLLRRGTTTQQNVGSGVIGQGFALHTFQYVSWVVWWIYINLLH